jgi:nucleoside-diphosphate-sugar epimerase
MRLLITGSEGFVGKRLMTRASLGTGDILCGYDRARPTLPLTKLLQEGMIDTVIHCAAHACIRDNWTPDGQFAIWQDNVTELRWMLNAFGESYVKTVIFCSSNAVTRADGEVAPRSPYAASKLAGEAFVQAYAAHFGWRWHVARLAPMFGIGYHRGHVADFVAQAKESGKIMALSQPARRAALHVDDACDVLLAMARFELGADRIDSVSSSEPWSIGDTARVMDVPIEYADRARGWVGDESPYVWPTGRIAAMCKRPIESGVRDALASLGWP